MSATFSVTATGTTPLAYQWQRGSVNISGATSSSYTRASAAAADNGATFRCVVTNSVGSATSNAAILTVTFDIKPPTIVSAAASIATAVEVVFSEPVGQTSAQTVGHYAIDQGITISAASLGADLKTVTLTTPTLPEGVIYTIERTYDGKMNVLEFKWLPRF